MMMSRRGLGKLLAGAFGGLQLARTASAQARTGEQDAEHRVLELRQYKIVHGARDRFIELFDREFVETQEAAGMRLIGQFRDLDDPDRFTWIREFANMVERQRALTAFYGGPVWLANRNRANPMLEDNDNVLLLRAADPGMGFPDDLGKRTAAGANADAAQLIVGTIHYLWKDPSEGFVEFFKTSVEPRLKAAGLPVIAAYFRETTANNFPRLPVREGEKLFVWFTRVKDPIALDQARQHLSEDPLWKSDVAMKLADFEERQQQTLRLTPTSRSMLR